MNNKIRDQIRHQPGSGFTLLELMIAIAVIGTVVIITIPNFNTFNQSRQLKDATQQLHSDLRTAQGNALSGLECGQDQSGSSLWRLVISGSQSYRLEALCSNSQQTVVVAKTVNLPSGITFDQLIDRSGDNDICTVTDFSSLTPAVHFTNISATTTLDFGGQLDCLVDNSSTMVIKLNSATANITADVVVEKGGSIYVQ